MRLLVLQLQDGQLPGDETPDVGYVGVYKERLRNRSARRGKQGGFRVIYYVPQTDQVFLLLLYSKTEVANILAHEIRQALERAMSSKDA